MGGCLQLDLLLVHLEVEDTSSFLILNQLVGLMLQMDTLATDHPFFSNVPSLGSLHPHHSLQKMTIIKDVMHKKERKRQNRCILTLTRSKRLDSSKSPVPCLPHSSIFVSLMIEWTILMAYFIVACTFTD